MWSQSQVLIILKVKPTTNFKMTFSKRHFSVPTTSSTSDKQVEIYDLQSHEQHTINNYWYPRYSNSKNASYRRKKKNTWMLKLYKQRRKTKQQLENTYTFLYVLVIPLLRHQHYCMTHYFQSVYFKTLCSTYLSSLLLF